MSDTERWLHDVSDLLDDWSGEADQEAELDRLLVVGQNLALPRAVTGDVLTILRKVTSDLGHLATAISDELSDVRRQRAELVRSARAMQNYAQSLNGLAVVPIER
jgi:hypothetical protein